MAEDQKPQARPRTIAEELNRGDEQGLDLVDSTPTELANVRKQIQEEVREIEEVLQSGDKQPQVKEAPKEAIKKQTQAARPAAAAAPAQRRQAPRAAPQTPPVRPPSNQARPAAQGAPQAAPVKTQATQAKPVAPATRKPPVQTAPANAKPAAPIQEPIQEGMDSGNEANKQEKYQQIVEANPVGRQETWLLLEEFLHLSGLERERVEELIREQSIKSREEHGRIYVEASTGTSALIKKVENRLVSIDMSGKALDPVFVEKTIATILGLHDKVISSKDETISAFKSENSFLKEALVSMQEIYDDDKKTIELLREQLQKTQEEVDFVKRKYKLMWGRVKNSTN